MGVAPEVYLANVHVARVQGAARTSEVILGLQWIYEHKDELNIRVVNISLNSTVEESYHTSPLDAALEVLWFNGIVVVVSAGNRGEEAALFPPANDPFVITVGALDDRGTTDLSDDTPTTYSAYGETPEGFVKPDILAPGHDIVSLQPYLRSVLSRQHPDHRVGRFYFRMSGTSMASAVASGAVALLLQDEPDLNPDQVKYRLLATARPALAGATAGSLDIYAAVHGDTTLTANTGIPVSQLIWTGSDPVSWGSVNWGAVNWGAVNWGAVNWGSVNWGADYWGP
jgi:serine protease AprX